MGTHVQQEYPFAHLYLSLIKLTYTLNWLNT